MSSVAGLKVVTLRSLFLIVLSLVAFVLQPIAVICLYVGLIGFMANAVQFGMDQLHDSPGEDRTLFIHWYMWTYYASQTIAHLALNLA